MQDPSKNPYLAEGLAEDDASLSDEEGSDSKSDHEHKAVMRGGDGKDYEIPQHIADELNTWVEEMGIAPHGHSPGGPEDKEEFMTQMVSGRFRSYAKLASKVLQDSVSNARTLAVFERPKVSSDDQRTADDISSYMSAYLYRSRLNMLSIFDIYLKLVKQVTDKSEILDDDFRDIEFSMNDFLTGFSAFHRPVLEAKYVQSAKDSDVPIDTQLLEEGEIENSPIELALFPEALHLDPKTFNRMVDSILGHLDDSD